MANGGANYEYDPAMTTSEGQELTQRTMGAMDDVSHGGPP